MTLPYAGPSASSAVSCSMSSRGPSLLVHRPFSSCNAACVGTSLPIGPLPYNAIFCRLGSRAALKVSRYPRHPYA